MDKRAESMVGEKAVGSVVTRTFLKIAGEAMSQGTVFRILRSQHSGGRGRWISEFEAGPVSIVTSFTFQKQINPATTTTYTGLSSFPSADRHSGRVCLGLERWLSG